MQWKVKVDGKTVYKSKSYTKAQRRLIKEIQKGKNAELTL